MVNNSYHILSTLVFLETNSHTGGGTLGNQHPLSCRLIEEDESFFVVYQVHFIVDMGGRYLGYWLVFWYENGQIRRVLSLRSKPRADSHSSLRPQIQGMDFLGEHIDLDHNSRVQTHVGTTRAAASQAAIVHKEKGKHRAPPRPLRRETEVDPNTSAFPADHQRKGACPMITRCLD